MSGGQAGGGDFDDATRSAMPEDVVTTLHILRHGEVADHATRHARGQLDVPLTAKGEDQHAKLVRWFASCEAKPDRIVSSDLSRCRDLASRLATTLGLPFDCDARLREQSMGDWEGRPWDEITKELGTAINDYWDDYFASRPPNGESLADLAQRVGAWWDDVAEDLAGKRVVIVAHVGVIRSLMCHFLRVPADQALRFAPAVASHTRLLLAAPGVVVETFGERPWLTAGDDAS